MVYNKNDGDVGIEGLYGGKMRTENPATIKQIFEEHWPCFTRKYRGRIRKVVMEDVKRMLSCGDLSNGYLEFSCDDCGEVKKVGFKCRSRFCTSCGKVYVDSRANNMTSKLIRVKHRHMVFTIAEELREYFLRDRKLLSLLPQIAYDVIKRYFHRINKSKDFVSGMVCVIHTFGRDLKWNPHVHCLVPEGGQSKDGEWRKVSYFPYDLLRKSWQRGILSALEKKIKKGKKKYIQLKNKLYAVKQNGFYVYGKSEVKDSKAATSYVGRYTGRPAISNSRISKYDGEKVTIWYKDHETGKRVEKTMSVEEFIKRVIRHIPDRQFKMIRYYGIYANNPTRKPLVVKMVHEKVREVKRRYENWRNRIQLSFGYDPLQCEKCGGKMTLSDVFYPKIGSVLKLIEKREYEKLELELALLKDQYNGLKTEQHEPLFVGG